MKKLNWLLALLVVANLAVFFGYQALHYFRSDSKAPEIEISASTLEVSCAEPKTAFLEGITATDNKDGDVTASLVVENISLVRNDGTIQVRYAAFDKAGNVAKAEREVKYTDYESPKFRLTAPLLYSYGSNFDVLSNIGATDFLDGDIQHRIRAALLDEESITTLGVHNVQFQVSNSLGDTVKLVLPVEVYLPEEYSARMTLTDYLIYLPSGAVFNPEAYLDTFMLSGEKTDLRAGLPANFELDTTGQVMSQYPGVYPVEFRVTYTVRHETNRAYDREYVAYSKMIVVVEG